MRKIRNFKNKNLNSKKIIGLASLVLAGSLLTSCTINLSRKEHEYRRVNFTSNGNYYESSQFEPFYLSNKPTNSLIYYNEWKETADGNYSRIVKEYDVTDKSYDDIISLKDNKNINIDEVTPISDNIGTSYYYKADAKNNYIKVGNKLFRIIRNLTMNIG